MCPEYFILIEICLDIDGAETGIEIVFLLLLFKLMLLFPLS
jgi:hypothetical protein